MARSPRKNARWSWCRERATAADAANPGAVRVHLHYDIWPHKARDCGVPFRGALIQREKWLGKSRIRHDPGKFGRENPQRGRSPVATEGSWFLLLYRR